MNNKQRGFTLVELVMVIVILGILAAIAVPRFLNLTGDAAQAARDGTRGALNSALQMVRSRWIAQGSPTTILLDGVTITIDTTTNPGYPAFGTTSYDSDGECRDLVGALLGGAPPTSGAACGAAPLRVQFSGGNCQVHACPTDFPSPIVLSGSSAI